MLMKMMGDNIDIFGLKVFHTDTATLFLSYSFLHATYV